MLEIYLTGGYVITVEDCDDIEEVKRALERKEKFITIYYARVEAEFVTEPTHYCVINTDNIVFVDETIK